MSAPESAELQRLRAEIAEQPETVARVLDRQRGLVRRVALAIREREPRALVLVARGSSDNAAIYGRYLFEIQNRLLTALAAPSSVTLYGAGPALADTAVVGVSQSGQGEDVVSYLRAARAQGAMTVAIVNDGDSPLAEAAEWVLECLAGPEVSVPATKTVAAQMALLASLSVALGGERTLDDLGAVPAALGRAIDRRGVAVEVAAALAPLGDVAVIGRGFAFPVALETALKLKETSYVHAEPFSAADFVHGPVALVDEDFGAIVVDVGGESTRAAAGTGERVRERGGRVFALGAGRVGAARSGEPALLLPAAISEPYAPIAALVLGQLLAVELAIARGVDPARPRGLRKVTSTR